MNYRKLEVGSFPTNCYLIGSSDESTLYVIDPGAGADEIIAAAGRFKYKTARILLTHGHFDHIGQVKAVAAALGVSHPELAGADDELYNSRLNVMPPYFPERVGFPAPTGFAPSSDFRLLALPGHSPGGSGFLFGGGDDAVLFCGDTIFAGSVGRTDLWGGSDDVLINSIKQQILALPDTVELAPGHGEGSTVGIERRTNPYLQ